MEPTTVVPPHTVRVAVLGCIDDRLVETVPKLIAKEGGGFKVSLAGGGAAVLLGRDAPAAIGNFRDAFGIEPYEEIIILMHFNCGKLELETAPDGDLAQYDPASLEDLYRIGDRAGDILTEAIAATTGGLLPFRVIVIELIEGPHGKPADRLYERDAVPA